MQAYTWWLRQGSSGIVEAVTGTGKTLIGIAAIADAFRRGVRTIVVVPTIVLQAQWHREISRRIPGIRLAAIGGSMSSTAGGHDVLVAVVNSVARRHSALDGQYGLLVADECHRYGAESYRSALLASAESRLGLTATMERLDDAIDAVIRPYFGDVFVYDYDRATTDGVLASFVVAQAGVNLTPAEREAFEAADAEFKRARSVLISRYQYPSGPDDFGEFMNRVTRAANSFVFFGEAKYAKHFVRAFAERRRILAETPARLELLDHLGRAIEGSSRALVFTETKEAANAAQSRLVEQGVSAETYHSDIGPQEREARLRAFSEGRCRALVAVRALDEGVDVPEVDLGIILTASRQKRQMIQRLGRVIRRKPDGRYARLVNVFAIGTPEDPVQGGHEAFYELLENAADEIERFEPEQVGALLEFLRRYGTAGARPAMPSLESVRASTAETVRDSILGGVASIPTSGEAFRHLPDMERPLGTVRVGASDIDLGRSLEIAKGVAMVNYRSNGNHVGTLSVSPNGVRTLEIRVGHASLRIVEPSEEALRLALALAISAASKLPTESP